MLENYDFYLVEGGKQAAKIKFDKFEWVLLCAAYRINHFAYVAVIHAGEFGGKQLCFLGRSSSKLDALMGAFSGLPVMKMTKKAQKLPSSSFGRGNSCSFREVHYRNHQKALLYFDNSCFAIIDQDTQTLMCSWSFEDWLDNEWKRDLGFKLFSVLDTTSIACFAKYSLLVLIVEYKSNFQVIFFNYLMGNIVAKHELEPYHHDSSDEYFWRYYRRNRHVISMDNQRNLICISSNTELLMQRYPEKDKLTIICDAKATRVFKVSGAEGSVTTVEPLKCLVDFNHLPMDIWEHFKIG